MVNAEKYDDQLKTSRKIAQYISTHFGLSKEDLPETLRLKFEEFATKGKET